MQNAQELHRILTQINEDSPEELQLPFSNIEAVADQLECMLEDDDISRERAEELAKEVFEIECKRA